MVQIGFFHKATKRSKTVPWGTWARFLFIIFCANVPTSTSMFCCWAHLRTLAYAFQKCSALTGSWEKEVLHGAHTLLWPHFPWMPCTRQKCPSCCEPCYFSGLIHFLAHRLSQQGPWYALRKSEPEILLSFSSLGSFWSNRGNTTLCKCPSKGEWINKICYVYTKYYSAI